MPRHDAEAAVDAIREAGVTLGLGYNRRFHPEMTKLRERIRSGGLGVVMHVEATMTFPNALFLTPSQWRANREETPCGGLTPMGVHAVDGMIDLCGAIDQVYCQSFRRVVEIDADDTTSILFRMKDGMSGYLGTITATGPGFSFQVFGSDGLGTARGDDARRRRVVRGAADAALRRLQVPAAQGAGGGLGGRAVRLEPRGARGVRDRRRRRAGIPDHDRGDDPRRGGHRGGGALRRLGRRRVSRLTDQGDTMDLGNGLGHLTYSTLVHPGDTWDDMWTSLTTYVPQVKAAGRAERALRRLAAAVGGVGPHPWRQALRSATS